MQRDKAQRTSLLGSHLLTTAAAAGDKGGPRDTDQNLESAVSWRLRGGSASPQMNKPRCGGCLGQWGSPGWRGGASILTDLCMCGYQRFESKSRSVVSDCLQPHGLYSPWNSPGQNTGVGSLSLLQGIFPTQGWNLGLPRCWWILYQLSHKRSPRILAQIAYPFSSGSSQPRNLTRGSCMAGGLFTNRALRETSGLLMR